MRFLVISTPRPERPSTLVGARTGFWAWARPLQGSGEIESVYARLGRGVVAIFNVDSPETLHRYLNEWADIVPAHFDLHPLIDPDAAQAFLAAQVP